VIGFSSISFFGGLFLQPTKGKEKYKRRIIKFFILSFLVLGIDFK
jgi:hypothetical protein